MPRTIMITGSGGQVGHELAVAQSKHRKVALSRQQLDITDSTQVRSVIAEHKPDILINAAAYTAVDRAEEDADSAYAVNRDAIANLARPCRDFDIPVLHISTDYVFDGEKQDPYTETDPIGMLGVYGASKAAGEAKLREIMEAHIILRTSWVFSATGSNFVRTMLRLGKERGELNIVDDQFGCPTSARSIAEVLLRIAERYLAGESIAWGTYHFCNQPATSWFGFALEIFRQARGFESVIINPIPTDDYPTPAKRPRNSVLDCTKLEMELGISGPLWKDELRSVLLLLNA